MESVKEKRFLLVGTLNYPHLDWYWEEMEESHIDWQKKGMRKMNSKLEKASWIDEVYVLERLEQKWMLVKTSLVEGIANYLPVYGPFL